MGIQEPACKSATAFDLVTSPALLSARPGWSNSGDLRNSMSRQMRKEVDYCLASDETMYLHDPQAEAPRYSKGRHSRGLAATLLALSAIMIPAI